jgi:hypothetical protein
VQFEKIAASKHSAGHGKLRVAAVVEIAAGRGVPFGGFIEQAEQAAALVAIRAI